MSASYRVFFKTPLLLPSFRTPNITQADAHCCPQLDGMAPSYSINDYTDARQQSAKVAVTKALAMGKITFI